MDKRRKKRQVNVTPGEKVNSDFKYAPAYGDILERISDGILSLDKDGKILFVNQTGAKFLNRKNPKSLINKNIWKEFPDALENPFHKAFDQAIKTQKRQILDLYSEMLDVHFDIHIFPSIEGLTVYFSDISARKQIELENQKNLAFIQKILDSSPNILFLLDIDRNRPDFHLSSLERVLGYSRNEIETSGIEFAERISHPDDFKYYRDSVQAKYKTLADDEALEFDIRLKNKAGEWRIFHGKEVVFSRKPDGTPAQILGIGIDVTERRILEKEKHYLETTFRLALENIADMITIYGRDGRIKLINEATRKIIQLSSSDFVGKWDEEVLPPEIVEVHRSMLDYVRKKKQPQSLETNLKFPDGRNLSVRITCVPVLDEHKELEEAIIVTQDFTERKRAARRLQESEERYRLLIENSPYSIFIYQDDQIAFANPAAVKLLGAESVNDLIGRPFQDFIPEFRVSHDNEIIKSILSGKLKIYTTENEYKRSNGELIVLDITAVGFLLNNKRAVQIIALDITEKKKNEEALADASLRRDILIEHSRDGIITLDSKGQVKEANKRAAEMLGYTHEELMGLTVFDWDAQFTKERLMNMLSSTDQAGTFFETKHKRKDGSVFDVEISGNAVMFKGEKLLFNVVRDITDRKMAQRDLHKTLKQLRQAVAATIQVLIQVSEIRDPYTAGHQKRVADLARSIAEEIHLSSEQIEGIRIAASIHDIGKISIPSEILSKPTHLSKTEMELVRQHSVYGYEILKDIDSSWPLAEIVHQHHERMDGSGYPRGLKGKDILIEARILAVADVVEAMASHRPYRPARGIKDALEEIKKNKGILYDEQVVDACLKLFKEGKFSFK